MQKEPEVWFSYLQTYQNSSREFEVRFAVVSLLAHYIDEIYLDQVLQILNRLRHDGYYAKMAVAWAVSICYIQFPVQTKAFLLKNKLDDFTQNKAIQKIRESYRVSREEKEELNLLKRKGQTA